MYEVMKSLQDVDSEGQPITIYEYKMNSGTYTITPKTISNVNSLCQGRA